MSNENENENASYDCDPENLPDAQLVGNIRAARNRDRCADVLVNRYKQNVAWAVSILPRDLREGAMQNTWRRVLATRSLRRFDCGRPFRPWLVQIARNEAIKILRQFVRDKGFFVAWPMDSVDDSSWEQRERQELIDAVRKLCEERAEQGEPLLQTWLECEGNHVAMAERLGVHRNTIRKWWQNRIVDFRRIFSALL